MTSAAWSNTERQQSEEMNVNSFPALVWALVIYIITELLLDVVKRTPLWLPRQLLGPMRRLWGELCYLRALINDPDLNRWAHQYVTLRAIKARPAKGTAEPRPLLSLLQSYVSQGQQVVVLGEPGAGKTTTLEALSYRLARRAYQGQVAVWVVFLGIIALLMTSHSPWWALLLLIIPLFDFVFRRWPLPLLIELRHYEGGAVEDFLKKTVARRVGGEALSDGLRGYVERGCLVWLLDGVNEVGGRAYESALGGWRECFKPGHYFAHASVIFTSRTGENPAGRLGLEEVLEVLDLDNEGVRGFLRAYDSRDVAGDFAVLQCNNMLSERGLGRNPYWLKMMVESGLYTRNRGALFEYFARRLIQRELDKSPVRPRPSVVLLEDELEALSYLAYLMSDTGQVSLALERAEEELARWVEHRRLEYKPRKILDEAEAATLMRLSWRENRAEFAHQLMQEFFAAYALRLHPAEALRHADDPRWWETLLMLGGLVRDHTVLAQTTLGDGKDKRRLFLTVGLLRSVDEPDVELEHQVTMTLVENLRQGATLEHKRAAVKLAEVAGDEAVETLSELLQEEDRVVKEGTVEILGEIGTKKAAQILTVYLGDEVVAGHVAETLASIGEPAVEPLVAALRDQDSDVRSRTAEVLVQIGEPAVESLIRALRDDDRWVRRGVAEALGRIEDRRAVEPLIEVLGDELAAWEAAEALGQIGDGRAIEPLIAAMRDELVGWAAAEALVQIGAPAVEPLIGALGDELARRAAAEALVKIGESAVEPLIRALQDRDRTVRQAAAKALREIGEPAVEPLIKALQDRNRHVRWQVAKALGEIRDARALEPLIEALRDEDSEVRREAACALREIGGERALLQYLEWAAREDRPKFYVW